MVGHVLHVLLVGDLPVGVLGLAAVGADHDVLVADGLDDLEVGGQVALVLAAAHVLGVAALEQDVVVLDHLELVLEAHVHDPPLGVGDHDLLHARGARGLDDHEAFLGGDVTGAEHHVEVLDELEDVLELGDDLAVAHAGDAGVGVLAHLFQVVAGRGGGEPHDLAAELETALHGGGVDAAHLAVEGDAAEHLEIVVAPVDDLVMAVAEISAVHRCALVSLDDDGAGADTDTRLHQFKVVIGTYADIRI